MSGEPARGYRWRTFELGETTGTETRFADGNEASITHGTYSERKLAPRADQHAADLVAYATAEPTAAHLNRPEFVPAIKAWARAEAQVDLLVAYLERLEDWTGRTKAGRSAWNRLELVEARAERLRERLGLDPQARAKLGLAVAKTEAVQRSEHRPVDPKVQADIDRMEARLAELEGGDGG